MDLGKKPDTVNSNTSLKIYVWPTNTKFDFLLLSTVVFTVM